MVKHGSIELPSGIIYYGNNAHYKGIAPYPISPSEGDTWDELDAFGSLIGQWYWRGIYWMSAQLFVERFITNSAAFSATAQTVDFPVDKSKNLWIENFGASVQVNATSTPINFWLFTLSRANSAGTATSIASQSTNGQAANSWVNYKVAVNLHVNLLATGTETIRIVETRPSGTIQKRGTIWYEGRRVRT